MNINFGRDTVIVNIGELSDKYDKHGKFDDESCYVDGEVFIQMLRYDNGADDPKRWREVTEDYLASSFHKRENYFKLIRQSSEWRRSLAHGRIRRARYWLETARSARTMNSKRFNLLPR